MESDTTGKYTSSQAERPNGLQQLQRETKDFTLRFLFYQCRPAAMRLKAKQCAKQADSKDHLSASINELYMHMVDLAVLEGDHGECRYFLPFIAIDPATEEVSVKVVPFVSGEPVRSQQELYDSISMMREIDDFFHDTTAILPQDFVHIRELLKALFAYMQDQLHKSRKPDSSLEINFPRACKMLEALEFNPSTRMRDLYYQDKYDAFKKLTVGRGFPFDALKINFQEWLKAESDDPVRPRITHGFEHGLEAALFKKIREMKGQLTLQLRTLAEIPKITPVSRTKELRVDFACLIAFCVGLEDDKPK